MRYLGGKARLRDNIASLINQLEGDIYIEPFCGACWVGEIVKKKHRVFSDANYYLISMWQALQRGWIPPNKQPTEEEYKRIRDDDTVTPELKGFIGIAQSWGGKFWGGYARGRMSNGECRDYTKNCYNQTMKRIGNFKDATFVHRNYSRVFSGAMKAKSTMVFYLDPPYENTTAYFELPSFNVERFWNNVRVLSSKHYVLTSGYQAPNDFKVIREWLPKTRMNVRNNERLFAIGKVLEDYDL